ncbi:inactive poly [ADP-ribose] polymerase RCD1-like [Impatiens glandulifera]|uniref:inactive poly [ADP-ribose] polymerase RCD1-like n=1 Tax=Impatiens glandulifera TaxID=253017 RepID=UPI001FB16911|nr:inactive poly [ADP-ribose] polymerase RCD1-like [Impatiens glandulifera]XP_047342389.1 inactive poly [ADP-ribose] polymerase RCD1-like [Impatiens glandulifera]
MESEASTNVHQVIVDTNRRHWDGKSKLPLHISLNPSTKKITKRTNLGAFSGLYGGSQTACMRSAHKSYTGFTRSRVPKQLMYYQSGKWSDFPSDLVDIVKKDLWMNKATSQVEFNGHTFVLDFVHMMLLNLKTGLGQSIAWIDEADQRFFPETLIDDDEFHNSSYHDETDGQKHQSEMPHQYNNLKLKLKADVDGVDCQRLIEHSDESNYGVRMPNVGNYNAEVEVNHVETDQLENNLMDGTSAEFRNLDSDIIRKMFFMSLDSSVKAEILQIFRSSGTSADIRLELFQKQLEITKKYSGDANVRYAWCPLPKAALFSIMKYGIQQQQVMPTTKPTYGDGFHLTPVNSASIGKNYFDGDENRVQHMVLCRVIMGNMEVLHPGSTQFHPSSEEYDSGVDDLARPSRYVVWNMNINTHIYPEYVINFKVSSDAAGINAVNESKLKISSVNPCSKGLSANAAMVSYIPLLPLFDALTDKVHPKDINLIQKYYKLLQMKKMRREDFVTGLRLTVGDSLLRQAFANPKSEPDAAPKEGGRVGSSSNPPLESNKQPSP